MPSLLVLIGLLLPLTFPANAAIKAGTSCTKLNSTKTYAGYKYKCVKSGKKLVWGKGVKVVVNKPTPSPSKPTAIGDPVGAIGSSSTPTPLSTATPTSAVSATPIQSVTPTNNTNPFAKYVGEAAMAKAESDKASAHPGTLAGLQSVCVADGICPIGSKGPGGGVIFYDFGSQQSWGRYLEYAPNGWYGTEDDPTAPWCNVTNLYFGEMITDSSLRMTLGIEIGKGKANTDLLLAGCSSGAGVMAHTYSGGEKSDWFLPSSLELNELCKFARNQIVGEPRTRCLTSGSLRGGFTPSFYWSSSENEGERAWLQYFDWGYLTSDSKGHHLLVRPIRAF